MKILDGYYKQKSFDDSVSNLPDLGDIKEHVWAKVGTPDNHLVYQYNYNTKSKTYYWSFVYHGGKYLESKV